jgi:hypothetical protein
VKWKAQLRRKREADERKAKRDKELAMAAEAKRLEDMKSMAYRMGRREESAISTNTRIIRGTGRVRCCGVLASSPSVSLRGVPAAKCLRVGQLLCGGLVDNPGVCSQVG